MSAEVNRGFLVETSRKLHYECSITMFDNNVYNEEYDKVFQEELPSACLQHRAAEREAKAKPGTVIWTEKGNDQIASYRHHAKTYKGDSTDVQAMIEHLDRAREGPPRSRPMLENAAHLFINGITRDKIDEIGLFFCEKRHAQADPYERQQQLFAELTENNKAIEKKQETEKAELKRKREAVESEQKENAKKKQELVHAASAFTAAAAKI